MTLYHATTTERLASIKKEGLVPKIGKYAAAMGETEESVWLFNGLDEAEEMMPIWLEPVYGPELVLLEVTLPDDFPITETGSDYEVTTHEQIPAEWVCIYER